MRLSRYFMPTIREVPSEASIISHKLMLRAGMIQQITSGIYAWLPLGLAVLKKISDIIREEQSRIDCVEMLAPIVQPASLWEKSGRYHAYGEETLRMIDRHKREMLYGPTAEEVFTEIFRTHVKSYKELPKRFYNIQWKFRDEIRPRFGVMRGREFLMKDAYSFDLTKEESEKCYSDMFSAYIRTFKRMGLSVVPVRAETGPIGGNLSHEFQILADTGESCLYYDKRVADLSGSDKMSDYEGLYAVADDKHDEKECPISEKDLAVSRGIEVGHIFYFGDKYSKAMDAFVMTSSGKKEVVKMGSYGIGVSRLVGAIIEASHDDRGIIWPESVAPFAVALMPLCDGAFDVAEKIYNDLRVSGIEVFFDDRKVSPGVKFADMDLIGIPNQIIIGEASLKEGVAEIKNRKSGEVRKIAICDVARFFMRAS